MKILYVNDFDFRGGAETFTHLLASFMESEGHDVYFAFGETKEGDRRFKISRSRGKIFPERTVYWNVSDRLVKKQMRLIISSIKPDIVHLNNLMLLTLAPLIAAKELGAPRVISLHDYWPLCPRRSLLKPHNQVCTENGWSDCFHCAGAAHPSRLVRVAARCPALANKLLESKMKECYRLLKDEVLVCPSEFLRDVFIRFGYDQRNLRIIPHGVETDLFKPSFKFTDTLLWVGRITPLKGLEYFARVADVVRMRYPSTRFVATGKLASNGMYTYKQIPLTKAINFVGESPPEKLVEYYSNSLALVMTSVWPEPFGITALEAMACGKPVIAFASGGLSEIIVDGETGFLVKPRDHHALANKIMTFLEDRALAMKMGANARRLVERNYTLKKMCESYEKLYVNML